MPTSRQLTGLGLGLIAAHLTWALWHIEPAISGPDAGGYFLQARQLITEGHTWQAVDSPLVYVAPHWLEGAEGSYYSKYPPGFPLLLATFDAALGTGAALWVDPLLTALSLLALWLLCRRWLGAGWAVVAVLLMAGNPFVNQHLLGGFAHMAVACLLLWALYALERWRHGDGWGWALAMGLLVGAIPGARYAEILFAGAIAVVVARHAWALRPTQRRWWAGPLAGALGAALPVVALATRNHAAFGAFWRTGYTASAEQTGFGWSYFTAHWSGYLNGLVTELGPVFGLAVAGLGWMLAGHDTRARAGLLLGLILPTSLLYCAYYWNSDGMSQRFLLPTYFLYAIASVHLLRDLVDRGGNAGRAAAGAVVGLALLWGMPRAHDEVIVQSSQRARLAAVSDFVGAHVEDGAVLLVDGSVVQQLAYVGRWRLASVDVLGAGRPQRRWPRPASDDAGLDEPARGLPEGGPADERPRPMTSRPAPAAAFDGATGADLREAIVKAADEWTGLPGTDLHVLVPESLAQSLARRPVLGDGLREVARLAMPEAPGLRDRRGPGAHNMRRRGGGPGLGTPPDGAGVGAGRPGGFFRQPADEELVLLVLAR